MKNPVLAVDDANRNISDRYMTDQLGYQLNTGKERVKDESERDENV